MRKLLLIWLALGCSGQQLLLAQEVQNSTVEQQLENLVEAGESDIEDDAYYQQLRRYLKDPINLNTALEADLQPFRFLSDLQIQTFLRYRKLTGLLLHVYELQAIPGWDLETIARLLPYIKVGPAVSLPGEALNRFAKGTHTLLFRMGQTFEKSKGYIPKNDTTAPAYLGSPQRILVRYKYVYKNLVQYGFLGEKDAGEQFGKGVQKNGFDFNSMHLFLRNMGVVKQLAIGDFTVNLGQGLLTYQSLAFRKSVDVMNTKRQTEVFRPYNSPAETNFMRGAAITLGGNYWRLSVFGARQKISGNAVVDSVYNEDYISSILSDGYHRTKAEAADKNNITQSAVGGRLHVKTGRWIAAINAIHFSLSKPLQKENEPYNQFAFSGKQLTGLSGELAYTWRNLHAFAELAANPGGGRAYVAGLLASVDPRMDLSIQVRNMATNYHSLYANAFTESTTPINEKGMFMGVTLRPNRGWRIDAYADIYQFPWVKYRVDRPSKGKEYALQITWRPNKQVELYSRYKSETKAINYSNTNFAFQQTEDVPRQNWRTQISYKVSDAFTLRARTEMVWYDNRGAQKEQGFLLLTDCFYKPMMKPIGINLRLQYFETDAYNSRLYAFENDVLYNFTIPSFYDKGYRGYFNINYDVSQKLSLWFRLARTQYTHRTSIGSGNDEIEGNHKTDYRFQFIFTF
ncbi:MAG TPA: hypothetical protein VLC98_06115 [Phnomibacter sp.]|nr:hypothetical protein [Phnomibacter sp.]